jgi:hypothetical protein
VCVTDGSSLAPTRGMIMMEYEVDARRFVVFVSLEDGRFIEYGEFGIPWKTE